MHGELLMLGIEVAQSTVARYKTGRHEPPSQGWKTFLRNHTAGIASIDLFQWFASPHAQPIARGSKSPINRVDQVLRRYNSKTFGDLGSPGHSATHTTGVASPPIKVNIGNIPVTIFFSTQVAAIEGIEVEVQNRLKGAKKVRVIAMLISDLGILDSLLALKDKDIKGVLDPHEMKVVMKNKPTDPKFWFANGDPRFVAANSHAFNGTGDKNDFMHNKVMIIDDKMVITGSYNFSENAEANDENLLIFESAALAGAYSQYFDALFAQYQKTGAKLPPV
jgi:phosphatidylserine/phosphatidylglycerophosphate/cardiolipin synthase-like enzyme